VQGVLLQLSRHPLLPLVRTVLYCTVGRSIVVGPVFLSYVCGVVTAWRFCCVVLCCVVLCCVVLWCHINHCCCCVVSSLFRHYSPVCHGPMCFLFFFVPVVFLILFLFPVVHVCLLVCLFLQLCDGVLRVLRVQARVRGEQPPGGLHLRALLPRELEGAAAPTGE
jgi:hypothetical protein